MIECPKLKKNERAASAQNVTLEPQGKVFFRKRAFTGPAPACGVPLALSSAHAVLDEFSHTPSARGCATSVATIPSELFASLYFSFEHTGMLTHGAGMFLWAKRDRPTIFCKCS